MNRFRERVHALRTFAEKMTSLAKMPERTTASDLQLAADLSKKAADSLDELLNAELLGCVCRRIEHDNYSYLDYAESCLHHRQYYLLRQQLKADYAKMEKALKDEVRVKLVAAALTGTAMPSIMPLDVSVRSRSVVTTAIAIADEALRQIAGKEPV